jgi:hypothetical protein
MSSRTRLFLWFALALLFWRGAPPLRAEEGFWLFSEAPVEEIAQKYGVRLTSNWLDHLQRAIVRFNSKRFDVYIGGSGAFVSADGLVLTNRHVIPRHVFAALTAPDRDISREGFVAQSGEEELKLPGLSLDAVVAFADVTAQIVARVSASASGEDAERIRRDVIVEIEASASPAPGMVAEVVALEAGARYVLYVHRRYYDIRLVFAPEAAAAQRMNDHPAPAFDVALVRAYENGVPARPEQFLRLSTRAPVDGEPIFIGGAPTKSRRHLTVAELEAQRDMELPRWVEAYAKLHYRLAAFAARGADQASVAEPHLAAVGFTRQILEDRLASSRDERFLVARRKVESDALRAFSATRDEKAIESHRKVAEIVSERAEDIFRGALLSVGGPPPWRGQVITLPFGVELAGPLYSFGNVLLKLRRQRDLPESERDDGYRLEDRADLENWLLSPQKIDLRVESARLGSFFETLVETLGADHPLVRVALDGVSPTRRAAELTKGTKLGDREFRRALYASDRDAFDAARDPLLAMLRAIEPEQTRLAENWIVAERRLEAEGARMRRAAASIRREATYADATRTARFGFGVVRGWRRQETDVPAVTTIGAICGGGDASLSRWAQAAERIDHDAALDFVSTADVVAGNSGSATVDEEGRLVGVVFGPGAIEGAAAADFAYEAGKPRRAAHVAASAIVEALAHVYDAPRLVEELTRGRR